MPANIVRDPSLAGEGQRKIAWVRRNMPVLRALEEEFRREQPFAGMRATVSVHLEAKTAYLALVIAAGGAEVSVTGSNNLSTKDDVVAGLAEAGLHVYAWHGATAEEFTTHQLTALEIAPHIVIDDGGDLVHHLHEDARQHRRDTLGGCEETTAGVLRNTARYNAGKLQIPVLAVNDAQMKHLFDNRYGTGQSTMDAIMRTTNLLITGTTVVVVGYGWCGRGIAQRAAGMGAHVIVSEVDPVKALEARMDGYSVLPLVEAAELGDFFITSTGVINTIDQPHLQKMKDGAILANAGHFSDEINLSALAEAATEVVAVRENLTGYRIDGAGAGAGERWINVISQGRIVNIAAADGHPAQIMDTSFAVQALAAKYLADAHRAGTALPAEVIPVPREIDIAVAHRRLAAMGVRHDTLTAEQQAYLADYNK